MSSIILSKLKRACFLPALDVRVTLFNIFPWTVYPPFANDEAELLKSWEKLLSTGCQTFYPGHGKPFSRKKFRKFFDKRKW